MNRFLTALVWIDRNRYECAVAAVVLACLVGLHVTDKGLPD